MSAKAKPKSKAKTKTTKKKNTAAPTSSDDVYVLPSGTKWVVRRKSAVRATAVVETKAQAVRIARAMARETGSELIVAK